MMLIIEILTLIIFAIVLIWPLIKKIVNDDEENDDGSSDQYF